MQIFLWEKETRIYFYQTFKNISDRLYIEKICEISKDINFEKHGIFKNRAINMYGQEHIGYEVCSLGFYMMYITPEGDVFPCCNYIDPAGWGNIHRESLKKNMGW